MPTTDASPTQVVTAYQKALNAGDCNVATKMYTDVRGNHSTCGRIDQQVTAVKEAMKSEGGASYGLPDSAEVVEVWVERTVTSGGFLGIGKDATSGPWKYDLVRQSSTSPWRIFDEGLA